MAIRKPRFPQKLTSLDVSTASVKTFNFQFYVLLRDPQGTMRTRIPFLTFQNAWDSANHLSVRAMAPVTCDLQGNELGSQGQILTRGYDLHPPCYTQSEPEPNDTQATLFA